MFSNSGNNHGGLELCRSSYLSYNYKQNWDYQAPLMQHYVAFCYTGDVLQEGLTIWGCSTKLSIMLSKSTFPIMSMARCEKLGYFRTGSNHVAVAFTHKLNHTMVGLKANQDHLSSEVSAQQFSPHKSLLVCNNTSSKRSAPGTFVGLVRTKQAWCDHPLRFQFRIILRTIRNWPICNRFVRTQKNVWGRPTLSCKIKLECVCERERKR